VYKRASLADTTVFEGCFDADGYSRVMGHLYETAWDKHRWEWLKDKKEGEEIKR